MNGLVHLYEGDGKGKTTAAVGLSVRCAGHKKKVLFTQFLKDGSSGEIGVLKKIDGITVFSFKKKFGFTFQMSEAEKETARECYRVYFDEIVEKVTKGDYDLLVLDEVIDACNSTIMEEKSLLDFLKNRPKALEVVLTGRNSSKKVVAYADYYTKMQKIKHPFDQGVVARSGIER